MAYETPPSRTEEWRGLVEQFGNVTVQEIMNSGTSNLSLAQLVSIRAAFQMLTKTDARNFCRLENVPPGGGKVYHIQFIPAIAAAAITEATGLTSSSDYTLTDVQVTLSTYGIRTDITDLLQRQAAINFADAIGKLHGNGILQQTNTAIYAAVNGNSTNTVTISGSGEQEIAWSDILQARQKVESKLGDPDTLISGPKKLHELMRKDLASKLYTGAMQDYIRSGRFPTLAGMAVYSDPVYKSETYTGASGEEYCAVLQADEAVAWAQVWDVSTEIQRFVEMVGFKMVSSIGGGTARVVEPWIATVQHA